MNTAHGVLDYWGVCVVLYSVSLTAWTKEPLNQMFVSSSICNVPNYCVLVKTQPPAAEAKIVNL